MKATIFGESNNGNESRKFYFWKKTIEKKTRPEEQEKMRKESFKFCFLVLKDRSSDDIKLNFAVKMIRFSKLVVISQTFRLMKYDF